MVLRVRVAMCFERGGGAVLLGMAQARVARLPALLRGVCGDGAPEHAADDNRKSDQQLTVPAFRNSSRSMLSAQGTLSPWCWRASRMSARLLAVLFGSQVSRTMASAVDSARLAAFS